LPLATAARAFEYIPLTSRCSQTSMAV